MEGGVTKCIRLSHETDPPSRECYPNGASMLCTKQLLSRSFVPFEMFVYNGLNAEKLLRSSKQCREHTVYTLDLVAEEVGLAHRKCQ